MAALCGYDSWVTNRVDIGYVDANVLQKGAMLHFLELDQWNNTPRFLSMT